jgi:uncharacterized protein YfaS (alpha-2-macroglobulin family)
MVDNELQYLGQFPVELTSTELTTDAKGNATLELPAADKPSRYMLTVFASDGAAYRVKTTKEILIDRGAASFRLSAPQRFSAVGDKVAFSYANESEQRQRSRRAAMAGCAWRTRAPAKANWRPPTRASALPSSVRAPTT